MELYRWREIANVPPEGGIYAWYFTPILSDSDIDRVIAETGIHTTRGDMAAAETVVTNYLNQYIFSYFQEQAYTAILRGPLKPRYEGVLEHRPALSMTLVQRIVENPERLRTIKDVLQATVPNFSSPVYIGMAGNLAQRLNKHKALIERYLDRSGFLAELDQLPEEDRRDHSFAREVCLRRIPPAQLHVTVKLIPSAERAWIDLENILNRIHFPLLGRN